MAYDIIKPNPYYTKNGKNFYLEYDPSTGNVRMFETGFLVFGTLPLFENGTFDQTLLDRLGVSSQEKDALYAKMQTDVRNSWKASGGVANKKILPPWASAVNQGTTPNTSTTPGTSVQGISQAVAGLQNLFEPGLQGIANLNFESKNEKTLFGDKKLLMYPRDILEYQQDTLQISMYNYKAPFGDTFLQRDEKGNIIPVNPADIIKKGLQRNSALNDFIGTVILPIPSGIQDNNNISWGDDQMNNLSAGVAASMIKDPVGTVARQGTFAFINALLGSNLPSQSINNITALLAAGGGLDVLNNPMVKTAVVSLLLKNAGFDIPPETILARGAGIVPNSNLELLFQGPTLRQFGFNWRMSPRSELEAKNVKRIIRFFKQGSAPRKVGSKAGAGANSFFLGTPNIFKLSYKTAGKKEISGLNKFKICALVGMNVVYAPDGQWAAYDEGQPVSVTMTLNFQEIEPVYESDYQEKGPLIESGDNPSVFPEDVGY